MTIAVSVVALVLLAAAAVCFFAPLVVYVRAPDDGDIVSVELRHPAFHVDTWLPLDVVIHWLARIPEPPPVAGHVVGIPLKERALEPVIRKIAGVLSRRTEPEEEPEEAPSVPALPPEEKKPGRFDAAKKHLIAAAPEAAWNSLPRFRRAIVTEVFAFDLDYGTGDPVTTGLLSGYLWQLAAILPEPAAVRAQAHWMEPTLRVEGEARLLIFPARTLWAALCLGFAIARGAWKASRRRPDTKEKDRWPTRTETPAAAVAPPSSPS